MQNTGLNGSRTGIKITRRKINNLRYRDDATLMAESEEEEPLGEGERGEKNAGLKLNNKKKKN